MGILAIDWEVFITNPKDPFDKLTVLGKEVSEVLKFIQSTKGDIVETSVWSVLATPL